MTAMQDAMSFSMFLFHWLSFLTVGTGTSLWLLPMLASESTFALYASKLSFISVFSEFSTYLSLQCQVSVFITFPSSSTVVAVESLLTVLSVFFLSTYLSTMRSQYTVSFTTFVTLTLSVLVNTAGFFAPQPVSRQTIRQSSIPHSAPTNLLYNSSIITVPPSKLHSSSLFFHRFLHSLADVLVFLLHQRYNEALY